MVVLTLDKGTFMLAQGSAARTGLVNMVGARNPSPVLTFDLSLPRGSAGDAVGGQAKAGGASTGLGNTIEVANVGLVDSQGDRNTSTPCAARFPSGSMGAG